MKDKEDDWTIQMCYINVRILKDCRGTLCADGYINRMTQSFIVYHF